MLINLWFVIMRPNISFSSSSNGSCIVIKNDCVASDHHWLIILIVCMSSLCGFWIVSAPLYANIGEVSRTVPANDKARALGGISVSDTFGACHE